jgi:hypothetical protein
MKMIENRTKIGNRPCITFKKQIDERNFLDIIDGNGCDSFKGKLIVETQQKLNLNRRQCMNEATIAHELIHALGFDHEQNRPDRDEWVKINFKNVQDNEFNRDFRKLDVTEFQDFGTPYDYESIMHYDSYAHALNSSLVTIEAIKAPFEIKKNKILSDIDVLEIRKLYNCKPGILNFHDLNYLYFKL